MSETAKDFPPVDRATLRRLLAKATSEPWVFDEDDGLMSVRAERGDTIVCGCRSLRAPNRINAELIAALRNSASALLDRLEQVEQALDDLLMAIDAQVERRDCDPSPGLFLFMSHARLALAARPVPPIPEGK